MATTTTRAPKAPPQSDAGLIPHDPARPLVNPVLEKTAATLDGIVRRYNDELSQAANLPFRRAMLLAEGIDALRGAISKEFLGKIVALMGTPLGFGTDRGPGRGKNGADLPHYGDEIVRDCFIQSLLLGFYPVNKEWMIFKGQFFGCQAGWKRKLEEVPGISDVRIAAGIPTVYQSRTVVRIALAWRFGGKKNQLIGTDGKPGMVFPIATFGDRDSTDQTIGKAKAKAYKAAYLQVTGSEQTEEDEDGEVEVPANLAADKPAPGLPAREPAMDPERQVWYARAKSWETNLGWTPDEAAEVYLRIDADPANPTTEQMMEFCRIAEKSQKAQTGMETAEEQGG